jgi:hypothetical protein
LGKETKAYDLTRLYTLDRKSEHGLLEGLTASADGAKVLLMFSAAKGAKPGKVVVVQETDGRVDGGISFILRPVAG